MSERSEDSPTPGFTVEDLINRAQKGAPYYLDEPKKASFRKKPIGNIQERFPENLRDQFRERYRNDFHCNFQHQAERQFEEAFLKKEKTLTPEEESLSSDDASSEASIPSIETIPDPVSYTPSPERIPTPVIAPGLISSTDPNIDPCLANISNSTPMAPKTNPRSDPWIGGHLPLFEQGYSGPRRDGQIPDAIWRRFDEFQAGGHFDSAPVNENPIAETPITEIPLTHSQMWDQGIANKIFQDYISQCEKNPSVILKDMGMGEGFQPSATEEDSELPDLSYPDLDSRNEESYQDAREYLSPMPGVGEHQTSNFIDLTKGSPAVTQTTSYNSEIDRVVERAIEMFFEKEPRFISGASLVPPNMTFVPSSSQNLTTEDDYERDVEIISPEGPESEFPYPDQQAASVIFKGIYNKSAKDAKMLPDIFVHPREYLINSSQLPPSKVNPLPIVISDHSASNEAVGTNETRSELPPGRKIITLKVGPEKLQENKGDSKVTFKRVVEYRKEIRGMQRDGRFKDGDEVDLVKMEVKFPELQELVDNIWRRMKACLILHEDLFYGVVGFSRWSVEGRCQDPELFDMLMCFNRIAHECQKEESTLTLLDIVQEYTTPERRVDCHEFSTQVFPLPIRFFTTDQLEVEDPNQSSSSENSDNDDNNGRNKRKHKTASRLSKPKVAALSFMGKVAVRFNRSNGEFCFSGLYHLVKFGGRPQSDIDFHKHQKNGSPFAPGSGGTGSSLRYQRYGGSSTRSRLGL
ncbi:hypothetical protein TWF173_010098 [Orbilia oligospora]|nr:hypothetical protein TWF173_010098 [Orbilia oligospora]